MRYREIDNPSDEPEADDKLERNRTNLDHYQQCRPTVIRVGPNAANWRAPGRQIPAVHLWYDSAFPLINALAAVPQVRGTEYITSN